MKKMLVVLAMLAFGLSANAAIQTSTCDNLDGIVYGAFAPGDIGIHPSSGPDGSASVFWVPRDNAPHAITWNYADVIVGENDSLSFDIKNMLILDPATLVVWTFYNDASSPSGESIYCPPSVDSRRLLTDSYEHVVIPMNGVAGLTITRSVFIIEESGKVVDVDNLTLTSIPEPATMTILALGGLLLRKKLK